MCEGHIRTRPRVVTSQHFVDFMNRFPDTFQAVHDRTKWLTNSGCVAQALTSPTQSSTVRQTIMSECPSKLQADPRVAAAKDQPQHRPLLPKLDNFVVDVDEGGVGSRGRCQGWTIGPT